MSAALSGGGCSSSAGGKQVCMQCHCVQVDLSEVERLGAGSDRTGPEGIPVATGFLQGLLPVWSGVFYSCGRGSATSRRGLRKSTTVSSQCHCLSLRGYEDEDTKTKV